MDIKSKFLELTDRTYPHGTEEDILPLLNQELEIDEFGNLFIKIGESDVIFTSHLDTATSSLTDVVHVITDNIIKTDGKSILGADDKAGVTIMLYMIENKIPGLYYFFLGEEVGCIGSKKVSNKFLTEKIEGINKVISFDRRGTDSVITYQSSKRCCSDVFADALASELNSNEISFTYKKDTTGLLTDSIQFIKIYPECTNISVGYNHEHTFAEKQDIDHLEKLANACLKVKWNDLPFERDPSVTEYKKYDYTSYSGYGYGGWGVDDWEDYTSKSTPYYTGATKKIDKVWFHDEKFNYVSSVETQDGKIVSVDLCIDRILLEKDIIKDLFKKLDLEYDNFSWDGFNLKMNYTTMETVTTCNRNDIIEYLPSFDYSKGDDLKDDDFEDFKFWN